MSRPKQKGPSSVELTAQLAAARQQAGLSQREAARLVGITQAALSRIERGNADPSLSTALETAHALGLELRLVPRQLIPAVDVLLRRASSAVREEPERPLYELDADEDEVS